MGWFFTAIESKFNASIFSFWRDATRVLAEYIPLPLIDLTVSALVITLAITTWIIIRRCLIDALETAKEDLDAKNAIKAAELSQQTHGMSFDAAMNTWTVRSYADIAELIKHPHVAANFIPALMAGLGRKQVESYAFLVGWFSQWPLFQDGPSQKRLHSQMASFFSSRGTKTMV
jgi:hypothetical protein